MPTVSGDLDSIAISRIELSPTIGVLGAVVTIRREQKKRAIHINTLRAQGMSAPRLP